MVNFSKEDTYVCLASFLTVAPSATDTTITVDRLVKGFDGHNFWVVIDAFTSECEIRKVTELRGRSLMIAGLTYTHAIGDTVLFLTEPTVSLEMFGAVGDGSTNVEAEIQGAVDSLRDIGGGTVLGGGPSATYMCNARISITSSNITVDGRGAMIKATTGNQRFEVNGDPKTNGGEPQVKNVWIENWRFGDANNTSNRFNGVKMAWCENSGVRNIIKKGKGGGPFRLTFSKRCLFENITSYGYRSNRPVIMFFCHLNRDSVFRDCHARDGQAFEGFQNKGSWDHVFENCSCAGLNDEGGSIGRSGTAGFYERGDAPYKPSKTGTDTDTDVTYPFSTGSWDVADARRESRRTTYKNCRVYDSDFLANGFRVQEFSDLTLDTCFVNGGGRIKGINIQRSEHGSERGARIINCHVRQSSVFGLYLHSHDSTNMLSDIYVLGGLFEENERDGIIVDYVDRPHITGVICKKNNNKSADLFNGINIKNTTQPLVAGCQCYDDQGTPTQLNGIFIEDTCYWPSVKGCLGFGNTNQQINTLLPGHYSGNKPAEATAQTSDEIEKCIVLIDQDAAVQAYTVRIVATIIGRKDLTDMSLKRIVGLFAHDGSSAWTQIGSTTTLEDINSRAGWEDTGSFTVTDGRLQIQVQGAAATIIDWSTWYTCGLL
ncbi:MAG: right-handed parallel beta-helix repeat-containing protein [Deltaproteobacteria bacterium]|jgi:hypothetical protein|nr:right-handed parallel beta-helix repeat-containing protein [Deltaproteobacteria bacterium]